MNIFKRTPKKLPQNSAQVLVDPKEMEDPQTVADFIRRGYAFYARSEFPGAEADFRKAVELDPTSVDAFYALGMTYKAEKRVQDGVQAFQKAIGLIDAGEVTDRVRADMLHRLAVGHINELTEGDWNLEKEIWRREE